MKPVSLIHPAFLAFVVSCAAGGATGEPQGEPVAEAPEATEAAQAGYGYEMMPDPSTATPAATPVSTNIPEGRLAPEIIQASVRARFPAMRACYEAALQGAPALSGSVNARFKIQHEGTVTDVEPTPDTTMADATMVQCVLEVIAGTTFPETEGGIVTVVYPIQFSPGD